MVVGRFLIDYEYLQNRVFRLWDRISRSKWIEELDENKMYLQSNEFQDFLRQATHVVVCPIPENNRSFANFFHRYDVVIFSLNRLWSLKRERLIETDKKHVWAPCWRPMTSWTGISPSYFIWKSLFRPISSPSRALVEKIVTPYKKRQNFAESNVNVMLKKY